MPTFTRSIRSTARSAVNSFALAIYPKPRNGSKMGKKQGMDLLQERSPSNESHYALRPLRRRRIQRSQNGKIAHDSRHSRLAGIATLPVLHGIQQRITGACLRRGRPPAIACHTRKAPRRDRGRSIRKSTPLEIMTPLPLFLSRALRQPLPRGWRRSRPNIPENMRARMAADEARAWNHSPAAGILWESGWRLSRAIRESEKINCCNESGNPTPSTRCQSGSPAPSGSRELEKEKK